jgi:glycosyltransferase involved in cell wall biosynthesis
VIDKNEHQLVSVIIISYKNLDYIFDTINSIIIQNYANIELIISDDGSEEFNGKLYMDYIEKKNPGNIKNLLVHQNTKNVGTVKNINNAIKMSKGSIIKIIAADDALYDESVISSFVEFIEMKNSLVAVSKIVTCDEDLRIIYDIKYHQVFDNILKPLLTTGDQQQILVQLCMFSFIPAPGIFYTKKLFDQYGYFDESYQLLEDWPMWLHLVKQGCKIDYFDTISVKYRTNVGISMTPNEIYRKDNIRCYINEIQPCLKDFSYWAKKKIVWYNTRKWEYDKYSMLKKAKFIIKNIDFILIYLIPNKIKESKYQEVK